jgi:hypothetical protein
MSGGTKQPKEFQLRLKLRELEKCKQQAIEDSREERIRTLASFQVEASREIGPYGRANTETVQVLAKELTLGEQRILSQLKKDRRELLEQLENRRDRDLRKLRRSIEVRRQEAADEFRLASDTIHDDLKEKTEAFERASTEALDKVVAEIEAETAETLKLLEKVRFEQIKLLEKVRFEQKLKDAGVDQSKISKLRRKLGGQHG